MNVQAIIFEKENQVGHGAYPLPDVGPGQLLTETKYTFVSPGTELRVLAGHYGAAGNFPLIPGYCPVSEVIAAGADVTGFRKGDLVAFTPDPSPAVSPQGIHSHWGGQASHHLVPVATHPVLLPRDADPLDYVFTEVAAISLRGATAAQPQPGEMAVVIGQGAIGAFSAGWLAAAGCRVVTVDVSDYRLKRSEGYGAGATVNAGDPDAAERVLALTGGGADIVVESSGVAPGVELAHKILRKRPEAFRSPLSSALGKWPRLVYQANYLDTVTINAHDYFDGEGVVVLTPTDRGLEDRVRTVELLRQGKLNTRAFIDRVLPVVEAPAAYADLRDNKDKVSTVVIDWQA